MYIYIYINMYNIYVHIYIYIIYKYIFYTYYTYILTFVHDVQSLYIHRYHNWYMTMKEEDTYENVIYKWEGHDFVRAPI